MPHAFDPQFMQLCENVMISCSAEKEKKGSVSKHNVGIHLDMLVDPKTQAAKP